MFQEKRSGIEDATLDLRDVVRVIVRQRWLLIGVTVGTTLAVMFWTLKQPKIYEGVCTIEYDPTPPRPLGSEVEEAIDPWVNLFMSREWYETQNRILASRVVAEMVVRKLNLHNNPEFNKVGKASQKTWKGVPVEVAAQAIQNHIKIEQLKDTRLVLIRYRDEDPVRAQLIANTVADTYIDKTMRDRLGSTVEALEWLSGQLDNLKKNLEDSDLALHQFKENNNVLSLSLEDRQNIVAKDIESYDEALTKARTRRIELASILKELQGAKDVDPLLFRPALTKDSEALEDLHRRYIEKETQRKSLAVKYGEEHPQLKSLTVELETIRNQIETEIERQISTVDMEFRQVQSMEQSLQATLNRVQKDGLQLNLQEIQYSRLTRMRENNAKLYELLLQRTTETGLARMLKVAAARVIDRALRPEAPVSPYVKTNISVGFLVGLLFAFSLAFLVERLDRTVKTVEDAEALGLNYLGFLPIIAEENLRSRYGIYGLYGVYGRYGSTTQPTNAPPSVDDKKKEWEPDLGDNKDLTVHQYPKSAMAECCRNIRTNLTFMSPEKPLRALLVTSGAPREGKTTVAISIATVLAQSGKRVLLVDTDLRRPRIHHTFDVPCEIGITSVLVGEHNLLTAVQPTVIPNLSVLPCGPVPPNPSELLHTTKFREIIEEAKEHFDRVIFDSSPLGAVTDAAIIAPQVDGTIVIARARQTSKDMLRSEVRQLRDVAANILGCVLNEVRLADQASTLGGYYYYRQGYYYYAYGSDADTIGKQTNAAA